MLGLAKQGFDFLPCSAAGQPPGPGGRVAYGYIERASMCSGCAAVVASAQPWLAEIAACGRNRVLVLLDSQGRIGGRARSTRGLRVGGAHSPGGGGPISPQRIASMKHGAAATAPRAKQASPMTSVMIIDCSHMWWPRRPIVRAVGHRASPGWLSKLQISSGRKNLSTNKLVLSTRFARPSFEGHRPVLPLRFRGQSRKGFDKIARK
jgi:hypothetical protein